MTTKKLDPAYRELLCILVFGVVGALLGFGESGSLQAACLGAGVGASLGLALLMFS